MITVTTMEVIFFMLLILIISGVRGLDSFLGSTAIDICLGFNLIALVGFAVILFTEALQDVIEYVYGSRRWKCYLTNILAIFSAGYMYFKYLYDLPGTSRIAGTVFIIIFYAIYLLTIGTFYLIEDKTDADTASHTNVLMGILLTIIIALIAILNMWNIGFTVTRNEICNDTNVAYYMIPWKDITDSLDIGLQADIICHVKI